ncbi:MAG: ABC transporter permease [Bdellovibrionaceae bacterium]|nr:ABC transporter permease [Pseudobdellovibrionaceae bacterium]
MLTYLLRRLLQGAILIVVLSYLCFYLMTLMPGDPVDMMISSNPKITAEDVERLRKLYGLDQPAYLRYSHWVKDILSGDLGYSRTYRVPVQELLAPRLLNTFILSITALCFSVLIAVPAGVFSALRPGSRFDHFINFISFAGISIPSFWLGIVCIILFAVWIPLFPAGGTLTIQDESTSFGFEVLDRLKYLVLPVLSLSLQQIGRFARYTRSAMQESLRHDYIRTATAKGLSQNRVVWVHGFRNALIPLITVLALSMSSIFSGAIITETVFAYQGVGKLTYDSINSNDYNVAMISFIISVTMVLMMNFLADILYGVADPRIRYV